MEDPKLTAPKVIPIDRLPECYDELEEGQQPYLYERNTVKEICFALVGAGCAIALIILAVQVQ